MMKKLQTNIANGGLVVCFNGDFLSYDDKNALGELYQTAQTSALDRIIIDASGLQKWDSTLLVVVFKLKKIALARQIDFQTINFPHGLVRLFELAFSVNRNPLHPANDKMTLIEKIGAWGVNTMQGLKKGLAFLKQLWLAFIRFIAGKSVMRPIDFSFTIEDCSYRALPIVSLISFMVGLILAFVGAIQLQSFGAEIYVASLVAIGMTRIMGAIMTGVIMAGRTGASYAATIGTMQVNEEIDALKTLGINPLDFLVLPRAIALAITMPILTLWADFMGMIGGGTVGVLMLGIPLSKYWEMSVTAIKLNNFLVGIFHGWIFGIVIAVCGCYYGVFCGRNADSVGSATTKAVVSAIVWMIIMTGIITIICERLGV